MELSFGEQIKILLNRNHMTIQDLADRYEAATGNKMSRQNLTQRLKRDNFPEQDMHIFASLLGYRVSIQMEPAAAVPAAEFSQASPMGPAISALSGNAGSQAGLPPFYHRPGESVQTADIQQSFRPGSAVTEPLFDTPNTASAVQPLQEPGASGPAAQEHISFEIPEIFRKQKPQGDINPLTGKEYLTNTVRTHPDDPDYIQVYDQRTHSWSDVAADFFWEFQKKKKEMLGSDYQEPLLI